MKFMKPKSLTASLKKWSTCGERCLLFHFNFFHSPKIIAVGFEEGAAALEDVWKLTEGRKHRLGGLERGANNAEVCSAAAYSLKSLSRWSLWILPNTEYPMTLWRSPQEGTMTSQTILFSLTSFRKPGAGGNDAEFDHTGVRVSSKDEVADFGKRDVAGKTPLRRGFRWLHLAISENNHHIACLYSRQHGHNNFVLKKQSFKNNMSDLEDFYLRQEG